MIKWVKYSIFTVLLFLMIAGVYILTKTSYRGNDTIVLLNSGTAYTSFDDIIQRRKFKNKVVYVDVWGTNCPSCFEEFKNYTPQLTDHYKQSKNIAFYTSALTGMHYRN